MRPLEVSRSLAGSFWRPLVVSLVAISAVACQDRLPSSASDRLVQEGAATGVPAVDVQTADESATPPEASGDLGTEPRPSVLLIVVDTLRADRLPIYGFSAGRSPSLNRLARRSVVFDRAVAAAASTIPSHASMFTSRFVRQHSVGYQNGSTRLGEEETLAERFREAGYVTAGFISNVMLNKNTGFDRGFDHYDDELPHAEVNRPEFFERRAPLTTLRAIQWLDGQDGRPVFLLVHYQDPHGPYTPPKRVLAEVEISAPPLERRLPVNPSQSGFRGLPAYQAIAGLDRPSQYEERYLAEILFADRWMGKLLRSFEAYNPESGHIVLFTSDHGESMGEEESWFEHGHTSRPEVARIPFLLHAPGLQPERRSDPVSHVDIFPTLLELAGLPPAEGASGRALGPLLRAGQPIEDRELYCDLGIETAIYDDEGFTRIRFPTLASADRGDLTEATIERYGWDDSKGGEPQDGSASAATREYLSNVKPMIEFAEAPEPEHIERLRALGYIEPEG